MIVRSFVFIVAGWLCLNGASAATLSLSPVQDTTIYASGGSRSNGAGEVMYAGTNSAGSERRGLMMFDIAGSIPAGSTIDSVELSLVLASYAGAGGGSGDTTPRDIELHRLPAGWGEGDAGAGTDIVGSGQGFATDDDNTAATWSHRFYSGTEWTSLGADFDATVSASTTVDQDLGETFTWSSATMASDVQNWLDNPSMNFGWLLLGDEADAQTFRTFWTREAAEAGLRPALSVTYTPIPEPTTLALLILPALLAVRFMAVRLRQS